MLTFALAVVLAGCGSNNNAASTNAAATEAPASANAGTATEAAATTEPAAEKPTVAFVYIGPPGDGGYTYQHDQGRLYMEKSWALKQTS